MRLTLIDRLENMFASDADLYKVRHNNQQAKRRVSQLVAMSYPDTDGGLVSDAMFNVLEGWKCGEMLPPRD